MQENLFALLLLISAVYFSNVKSKIEDRFKEDFFNIYKHFAIETRNITNKHVTPDKIKYFLFTKKNPINYTEIDPSNPRQLNNTNVPIIFIIHGWTENREKEWYEKLKNAFLIRDNESYVVQVDWSDPATQFYTIASWNTKDVGSIIGKFVVGLHKNYLIPLKNFLIVGHSLGGHVSGYIGKKVKRLTHKKLPRLIALDPAGPLFMSRPDEERLNKDDAEVVQVIHTDGGTMGSLESCGTIDFFPNGGSSQPGCTRIDLLDIRSVAEPVNCDHHRSWEYFIEAVLNPRHFLGTKCDSWEQYKARRCSRVRVAMGDLESRETGDFYLDTNKDRPFGNKIRKTGRKFELPDLLSVVPSKLL